MADIRELIFQKNGSDKVTPESIQTVTVSYPAYLLP